MPRQSDAPSVPSDDAQPVADRYEVHELLGRGGMAAVYRAVDVNTGRQVALKHLLDALPHLDAAAEFPQLFSEPAPRPDNDNDNAGKSTARRRRPLRDFADPSTNAVELQNTLSRLMLKASRTRPLLIAVDDVHRIDAPSAALLATLIDKARRNNLSLALTADSDEVGEASAVLARRCETVTMEALEANVARVRTDKELQLLKALALHLLRAGDTTGISLAS